MIPQPYPYVGPPGASLPASPGGFWNAPFGATETWAEITAVDDAVDFFRQGRAAAATLLANPA
jgi:hypothetical protein